MGPHMPDMILKRNVTKKATLACPKDNGKIHHPDFVDIFTKIGDHATAEMVWGAERGEAA